MRQEKSGSRWNPSGGAGCVVARQTRFRLLSCEASTLHDDGSKVPLHRASILHRRPFGRRLHRTSALHGAWCRASLRRAGACCSSNRTVHCFTERRRRCGAHAPGDRPAQGQSIRPGARRFTPRTYRQRTGRSRCAARIRSRRVPPGPHWSLAGEPARAAGYRGRIASAVPNCRSGRARAALMQPRDSVARLIQE
jgi:hypothetical protein